MAVVVTAQPRDFVGVVDLTESETAVFSAAAADLESGIPEVHWQSSSDGIFWEDDPIGRVTSSTSATGEESSRLYIDVANAGDGTQYRAAFTTDGFTFEYSNAATLNLAADTTYWVGGAHTDSIAEQHGSPTSWSNVYNWSNGIPGPNKYPIFSQTIPTINGLVDANNNPVGPINHPFNGNSNVDIPFTIGGLFYDDLSDGSIAVSSSLELTTSSVMNGGAFAPTSSGVVTNDATSIINMNGGVVLQSGDGGTGGKFENFGTVIHSVASSFKFQNGAEFINEAGGVFDMDADTRMENTGNVGAGFGGFRNEGLLVKTAGTTMTGSAIFQMFFSNTGTMEADVGKLTTYYVGLTSGDTITFDGGHYNAATGAILEPFGGGNYKASGTLQGVGGGAVSLNVPVDADSAVTLNFADGLLQWDGGELYGANWTNQGYLTIHNADLGTTFDNAGTIDEVESSPGSGATFGIRGGATFTNLLGATYKLHANTAVDGVNAAGHGVFLNAGTLYSLDDGISKLGGGFGVQSTSSGTIVIAVGNTLEAVSLSSTGIVEKSAGEGTATVTGTFNNVNGTVRALDGKLVLNADGSNSGGSYETGMQGVIELAGVKTPSFTGTLTGTGTGSVEIGQGGAFVVGSGDVTLNFTSGVFLVSNGGFNLLGRTLENIGEITINDNTADVSFYGQSGNSTVGGLFDNLGRLHLTGSHGLQISGATHLKNEGTIDLDGDVGISGLGEITNTADGILTKSSGNGTATISLSFNNQGGEVDAQIGEIKLAGGGEATGGTYNAAADAAIDLTGGVDAGFVGSFTATGAGLVGMSHGGVFNLSGNVTLNGAFSASNGSINLHGATLTNAGTFTFTNASGTLFSFYGQNGNSQVGGTVNNTGTFAMPGDGGVDIGYNTTFNNSETVDLAGDGNFTGNFGIFHNQATGIVKKSAGSGTSSIGLGTVSNDGGTLQVDSGTLATIANYTDGHYNANGSAILKLTGGSGVGFSGNIAGSGTGSVLFDSSNIYLLGDTTFDFAGSLLHWSAGNIYPQGHAITNAGVMSVEGTDYQYIEDSFANNGQVTLAPGSKLFIVGDLTSGASSVLNFQLGGTPGSGLFGHLDVYSSNTAHLNGNLQVEYVDGFSPVNGSIYTVMEYGPKDGAFANFSLPGGLTPTISATNVKLTQQVVAPTFTSADHTTFVVGTNGNFPIATIAGATSITEQGTLPDNVTFVDNLDGTATLMGTPAAGTGGVYHFTLTAHGASDTVQNFTLTVNEAATITSVNQVTFTSGTGANFIVRTGHHYPAAIGLNYTGTLPSGITFTDNGNGTATIHNSTSQGIGTFSIDIHATNGVGDDTVQTLTITVQAPQNQAPLPSLSGASSGVPGMPLSFTLDADDSVADVAAGFNFVVQWGDDKSDTFTQLPGDIAATHAYAALGNYTVSLTVTDQHGASATVTSSVNISTYIVSAGKLYVGGTNAADEIVVSTAPVAHNTGKTIVIKMGNQILGGANATFTPTQVVIFGNGGSDNISAASGKVPTGQSTVTVAPNVPLRIFGGAGNDVINVKVNQATSVLIGNGGNDTLTGSASARDILIGGAGRDTLSGGGGDDVLIGGSTNYDNNLAALDALMAVWDGAGSYASRTRHLSSGSVKLSKTTVHDTAIDKLTGGSNLDYFVASTSAGKKDVIKRTTSEKVLKV